jgi:hypothetical protein
MIAGADGSGSDAGDACAEAVFDAVESVLLGERDSRHDTFCHAPFTCHCRAHRPQWCFDCLTQGKWERCLHFTALLTKLTPHTSGLELCLLR